MITAGVVLFDRERSGVRVTGFQKPSEIEGKYLYEVVAYVNGEEVEKHAISGYRETPNEARKIFKRLYEQHVPQAPKTGKAQPVDRYMDIFDLDELQQLVDHNQKTADLALARVSKINERIAGIKSGAIVAPELTPEEIAAKEAAKAEAKEKKGKKGKAAAVINTEASVADITSIAEEAPVDAATEKAFPADLV